MSVSTTLPPLPAAAIVIFGASGDLSRRKLLPALYHLMARGVLPDRFTVYAILRAESIGLPEILAQAHEHIANSGEIDEAAFTKLAHCITPFVMATDNAEDYHRLHQELDQLNEEHRLAHQRLYYLAVPPHLFMPVVKGLGDAGLNADAGAATRLFIEKPFGANLTEARALIEEMGNYFDERQVYRIDHYLAKETAQNLLAFRFSNPLIENVWGRHAIDQIQITASEKIGIEGRANFYEHMGALRDIVQSHLMQLMTLILVEAPLSSGSEALRQEKLAILNAIQPVTPHQFVRGQYDRYRDEVENQASRVETYIALKLEVANSRWGGVPILLRTGKGLARKTTEINVIFKDRSRRNVLANILKIRIQPDEGITLHLQAKRPGFDASLQQVDMQFSYQSAFGEGHPEAYERVLHDAMRGDQSLFASSDEVLRSWEILQPVLDALASPEQGVALYPFGAWGPEAADEFALHYGFEWINN